MNGFFKLQATNPMDYLAPLTAPVFTVANMPLSWGDMLGFVTGVICVWLTARANIWNFPAGILNSAILGVVFLQQRLFADAVLQVVFILLSAKGWYTWLRFGQVQENSPVARSTPREQLILAGAAVGMTVGLWQTLLWLKGSAPVLDALITALSLCAQWQLNRRQLSSWAWWIGVDLISIPLYWSRDLPLIAGLYCIFLLICLKGWRHWKTLVRPVAP